MRDFANKTAFITGGASGVGLGIAKALAKAQANVVIADIQPERLSDAEQQLRAITPNILALAVDTTDIESLQRARTEIEATAGPVSVLCNNAGIGGGGKILETADDKWRRVTEVNLWGPLNGVKVFLPGMLARGEPAHIVNTASFSGIQGHHSQGAYGTSKFAAVGFSEFLRNDLEGTCVSASVLCPHVVDTPIFYPDLKPTETQKIEARRETMPWLKDIAVSADTVGEQVLNGIRNNELYIFCDGSDSRAMLETRCNDLIAAMDRQFPKQ
ncbi:MAG: short-chain dehydrogenase [Gammaproteobacteria bacterium]|nr:short-chain dehydrogenase [Gammaproteobacteria bacterium]